MKNNIVEAGYKKAGYIRRLIACLIDWYICAAFAGIPIVIFYEILFKEGKIVTNLNLFSMRYAIVCGFIAILICLIYYICVPIFWREHRGQTLGKRIVNIQVRDKEGGNVSVRKILLRELFAATLIEGGYVATTGYLRSFLQLFISTKISSWWLAVSFAITFISILCACFTPTRRMFHDYIAQTIVIQK